MSFCNSQNADKILMQPVDPCELCTSAHSSFTILNFYCMIKKWWSDTDLKGSVDVHQGLDSTKGGSLEIMCTVPESTGLPTKANKSKYSRQKT